MFGKRTVKHCMVPILLLVTYLVIKYNNFEDSQSFYNLSKECSDPSRNLTGSIKLNLKRLKYEHIEAALLYLGIQNGGYWKPKNCKSTNYVAILIPYKNRLEHLNAFLVNMHPIFARQQLAYKLYVIEPYGNITFNRGLLFNIGFIESNKDSNDTWDCHVYHDVDLLSEDDRTLYTCSQSPRHLAQFINKHNYKLNYLGYFGGVTLLSKEHFIKANGYSNFYFRWGSEDDDHLKRLESKNLFAIFYTKLPHGKYFMFKHTPSERNPKRNEIRSHTNKDWFDQDGLNTVKYKVVDIIKMSLYTKYIVYYDENEYEEILTSFLTKYSI